MTVLLYFAVCSLQYNSLFFKVLLSQTKYSGPFEFEISSVDCTYLISVHCSQLKLINYQRGMFGLRASVLIRQFAVQIDYTLNNVIRLRTVFVF